MASEHDEADRERRRQEEPDRSPEHRPERGGDHDGDGRQSRMVTVGKRLHQLANDGLDAAQGRDGPQAHRPARIDRGREPDGQHRADDGSDIWDEPRDREDDAEQDGARHADQPQHRPDRHTRRRVQRALGQQIAAEALSAVVDGSRRALQIAGPEQADGPVPQVLPLKQDEDDEDQDDKGGGERVDERREDQRDGLHRTHGGLHDLDRKWLRLVLPGLLQPRSVAAGPAGSLAGDPVIHRLSQLVDRDLHLFQGPRIRQSFYGLDLVNDRVLVVWQIGREVTDLAGDQGGQPRQERESEQHRDEDGQDTAQSDFSEHLHRRRHGEAQQHRERDGDEDLAAVVERRDDAGRGDDRAGVIVAGLRVDARGDFHDAGASLRRGGRGAIVLKQKSPVQTHRALFGSDRQISESVIKQGDQNDDRYRYAQQPKQNRTHRRAPHMTLS